MPDDAGVEIGDDDERLTLDSIFPVSSCISTINHLTQLRPYRNPLAPHRLNRSSRCPSEALSTALPLERHTPP